MCLFYSPHRVRWLPSKKCLSVKCANVLPPNQSALCLIKKDFKRITSHPCFSSADQSFGSRHNSLIFDRVGVSIEADKEVPNVPIRYLPKDVIIVFSKRVAKNEYRGRQLVTNCIETSPEICASKRCEQFFPTCLGFFLPTRKADNDSDRETLEFVPVAGHPS